MSRTAARGSRRQPCSACQINLCSQNQYRVCAAYKSAEDRALLRRNRAPTCFVCVSGNFPTPTFPTCLEYIYRWVYMRGWIFLFCITEKSGLLVYIRAHSGARIRGEKGRGGGAVPICPMNKTRISVSLYTEILSREEPLLCAPKNARRGAALEKELKPLVCSIIAPLGRRRQRLRGAAFKRLPR